MLPEGLGRGVCILDWWPLVCVPRECSAPDTLVKHAGHKYKEQTELSITSASVPCPISGCLGKESPLSPGSLCCWATFKLHGMASTGHFVPPVWQPLAQGCLHWTLWEERARGLAWLSRGHR